MQRYSELISFANGFLVKKQNLKIWSFITGDCCSHCQPTMESDETPKFTDFKLMSNEGEIHPCRKHVLDSNSPVFKVGLIRVALLVYPPPTRPLGPLPDPYPIPRGYLIPTGEKIK